MLIDALILAGGRSARLDGAPKSELIFRGRPLLAAAHAAVTAARRVVIVGPAPADGVPPHTVLTREDPAFGGPAAAIAAGVAALAAADAADRLPPCTHTIVVACDMPHVAGAVSALLAALHTPQPAGSDTAAAADGVIARDDRGRLQPLAAVYRTAALTAAIAEHEATGTLAGLSVFALIRRLRLREVDVPEGTTADVDTWSAAASFGIASPTTAAPVPQATTETITTTTTTTTTETERNRS